VSHPPSPWTPPTFLPPLLGSIIAEQKHVVKVPPMQTLFEALQAAGSKFKPALVPQQCALQYNKKPVDLNTPFRLLNVPAGSKLEIIISSTFSRIFNSVTISMSVVASSSSWRMQSLAW